MSTPSADTIGALVAPARTSMPMRVRVGVASALELSLRGEPVDLKPYTRDTSATVVLK